MTQRGRKKSPRVRDLSHVPRAIYLLTALALLLQILWHHGQPRPQARAEDLPAAPALRLLQTASFGEPAVLAKLLMLWLQAFDYQSGVSLSFRDLDRDKLKGWLGHMLDLDPRGQYPLLAATRFYGDIPVAANQREMSEFVYQRFLDDPQLRWPWLAHAAIIAKHRLKDLPLALKYARAIARHATGPHVPTWAKQMEFTVLEDMGELQSARLLIGGLLASGKITDPHEIHFLNERLQELEQQQKTAR